MRQSVNLLIYLSVAFGVVLLFQLYELVPVWLFYSVLVGWVAYLCVAVLVAKGQPIAYPLALVLAVLTLVVSLPQPQHYSYVEAGLSLASITFIIGSVLQIALIVLIPIHMRRSRSHKG